MSTKAPGSAPASTDWDDVTAVAMSDGTRLATSVYLPPGGRTKRPAVMLRVPYGRTGDICFIPELAAHLSELGLVVVGQDVRGKFDSEGERRPFIAERRDAYDTLDWIVRQGWSDGRVIALGDSYPGFTAWAAGLSGHPALRALIPRVSSTDVPGDWVYLHGVFRLQLMAEWANFTWSSRGLEETDMSWSGQPLPELLAGLIDRDAVLRSWASRSDDPREWESELPGDVGAVTVPTLLVGGWWDMFARGQIRDWERMRSRGNGYLVMRASDHEFHPHPDGTVPASNHMSNPILRQAVLGELYREPVEFIKLVLSDARPTFAPVRWELAHGGWDSADVWPPPRANPVELYLVDAEGARYGPEGGGLAARPDPLPSLVRWTHDPAALVPSPESDPWGILFDPSDHRDIETRDDVVTFSAERARERWDIVGPVAVTVPIATEASAGTLVATLLDVYPDGRAFRIVEGAARFAGSSSVTVDLGHTAYRLRPDHRLRLEIAASSFPRYLPQPANGMSAWRAKKWTSSDYQVRLGRDGARLSIYRDGGSVEA